MDALDDIEDGKFVRHKDVKDVSKKALLTSLIGKREYSDRIEFIDVPICLPNGKVILENLTFTVNPGENVLVVGPNGSGKSSMFRILGELWPLYGGILRKPSQSIFYIPQRPYLPIGTFRDQLIYPDSVEDMHRKGWTDNDLAAIIGKLELDSNTADGKMDSVKEWKDVLSGGDMQKVKVQS